MRISDWSSDVCSSDLLVTRLSNTLRHALEHRQSERVTLADELAVVRDYLAVEQVHYELRLHIREEIAEAALAATLPPMLLQQIGRATCRERALQYVQYSVVAVPSKKKKKNQRK